MTIRFTMARRFQNRKIKITPPHPAVTFKFTLKNFFPIYEWNFLVITTHDVMNDGN
jgi:hypothetical protein